jgi:hypothetical protein
MGNLTKNTNSDRIDYLSIDLEPPMNYTTTKDPCVSGDISSFSLNTSTLVPVETGLI